MASKFKKNAFRIVYTWRDINEDKKPLKMTTTKRDREQKVNIINLRSKPEKPL